MELSPNTPRQRNRRTERAAAQQEQSPVLEQQMPVVQRVQTDYPQQDIPGVMRSQTASVTSGVMSLGENPVPPVVITRFTCR